MDLKQDIAWYCARTKPKHEHIAAANLVQKLGLTVFNPRLRIERATRRGPVRSIEPLFPCYVFVQCQPKDWNEIRFISGVSTLVNFGGHIPTVPQQVIDDLMACFESEEPMLMQDPLYPGAEITVAEGAFAGFDAIVLRTLPSRQRVQVLLDILGRPTVVELGRTSVTVNNSNVADALPALAAR